ncbi:MAG TPA: hypothetical protein VLD13_08770 [Gaiellaceae bacterium]|nr:hypothetical protein [Gaiellaceae bacterium]
MSSVEDIEAAIRACTAQRQALREQGAGPAQLERNRLELVRLHRRLARAWIDRHLGDTGRAAA